MRDYTEIEKHRLEKVERLRKRGEEPYPRTSERTHTVSEALTVLKAALKSDAHPNNNGIVATLCGRLRSIRTMGKLAFAHIEDSTGRIQLMLRANDVGREELQAFEDDFDLGDFVQAEGMLILTRTGEATLNTTQLAILAKSISPLPAAKKVEEKGQPVVHSAFSNPESRYRERHVDLAVNPEVRDIFRTRSRIMHALREYLDNHGFIEVETPVLQPIYGGAAARPFTTHHNQLHQDLYLRISFELYLKRLLVGGFDAVYEIGRDFRNEGVSATHNPEFTQLEFYWAYSDYQDVMQLSEEMIAYTVLQIHGATTISYQGQNINFKPPWKRVDLRATIAEHSGIDYDEYPTADELEAVMLSKGHDPAPKSTRGKMIESLLRHYVEPKLQQPTFVYDYPRDVSPLAKSKPDDPGTVERFEAYVGGMELCNAFTELNDPIAQEQRFIETRHDFGDNDENSHPMDEDYLQAMRYGMPPNGGFGMGIDRLTMLLTDRASIREVILFPHLREKDPRQV